jgi:DNA gyrase inhibitor GyrI
MNRTLPILLLTLFIGGCSIVGTKSPEPSWHSVRQDGDMEIRDYDPMIVAEVTTTGERYAAINAGFRILAGYIFGGNTAQTKIAMTAPVTQESTGAKSEKIAMTAPVTQEASENQNEWKVRFVMPPEYTLASLPVPNDNRIKFLEIPAYRTAVIQFSGFNTDSNLSEHQKILMDWLAKNNITPIGKPIYAFYNPPWTLPFFKRNEVMVKISG